MEKATRLYDYSGFVEKYCNESDAVARSFVTSHDVDRHLKRLFNFKRDSQNRMTVDEGLVELDENIVHTYYGDRHPFNGPDGIPPSDWLLRNSLYFQYFSVLRNHTFGSWQYMQKCPICQTDLSVTRENALIELIEYVDVQVCEHCGWWETEEHLYIQRAEGEKHYSADSIHRRCTMREFNVSDLGIPMSTLKLYIKEKQLDFRHMNPRSLELLIYSVFREHMSCEVHHVGGPNDGGIDILIVDGGKKYGIQVKRRESTKSAESVSVIRELIGAMVVKELTGGILITTAPHFSDHAVKEAAYPVDRGHFAFIDLIDLAKLESLLELTLKNQEPPWKASLSTSESVVRGGTTNGIQRFYDFLDPV